MLHLKPLSHFIIRDHLPYDFSSYVMPGQVIWLNLNFYVGAPLVDHSEKGIGEMCANPVLPAIANAVFDAVGVEIDSLHF